MKKNPLGDGNDCLDGHMKQQFINGFYPNRCPYCDGLMKDPKDYACPGCKALLPSFSMERFAIGGYFCAAALRYDGSYAEAVKRFKFKKRAQYAPKLAFVITSSVLRIFTPEQISTIDAVTCVPMHIRDLRSRGYNQAELLARRCAELMSLPYRDAIIKIKYNRKQHDLSGAQRIENVRGVYRCADKSLVRGKNVLIIDDIITTGATLGACAKALKSAGAKNIYCAVLCTTVNY